LKKENEILNNYILQLDDLIRKEQNTDFDRVLKEFEGWVRSVPQKEKEDILNEAIPKIEKYIKQAEEKMKMYEDIGMDKTLKRDINQKYSQY